MTMSMRKASRCHIAPSLLWGGTVHLTWSNGFLCSRRYHVVQVHMRSVKMEYRDRWRRTLHQQQINPTKDTNCTMCMKAGRYAANLILGGCQTQEYGSVFIFLFWDSTRRWWDQDTRRDENPSGSGRLARVCVLARLYPGSGQRIHSTLLVCLLLLIFCGEASFLYSHSF